MYYSIKRDMKGILSTSRRSVKLKKDSNDIYLLQKIQCLLIARVKTVFD